MLSNWLVSQGTKWSGTIQQASTGGVLCHIKLCCQSWCQRSHHSNLFTYCFVIKENSSSLSIYPYNCLDERFWNIQTCHLYPPALQTKWKAWGCSSLQTQHTLTTLYTHTSLWQQCTPMYTYIAATICMYIYTTILCTHTPQQQCMYTPQQQCIHHSNNCTYT